MADPLCLHLKKLQTLLLPFFGSGKFYELLFPNTKLARMAMDCSSSIHAGRNDCMKHLVIDNEFEKIKRNVWIIEKRIDSNLIAMSVVATECHALKCANSPMSRPAN